MVSNKRAIPISFKWLFILFMAIYIPIFWIGYGPQNFLWLSSITLILTFLATLFESRFVMSMAAIGGLVPESLWVLDFLFTSFNLLIGSDVTGFTMYMFRPDLSIWLKILAFFHIALPPLLIWLILRLGYDARAWFVQVVFVWVLLLVTWFLTSPPLNINFVYSYEQIGMKVIPFFMILFGAAIVIGYLTHLFFKALQKRYSR